MDDTATRDDQADRLLEHTTDIASAFLSNNTVSVGEVGTVIGGIHAALLALTLPAVAAAPEFVAAVSERASIKPGHLISMIDGRPYKMLKRHLHTHGLTPDQYRQRYGLKADYPMVAADYAEQRRRLAKSIGLGTKGNRAGGRRTGTNG